MKIDEMRINEMTRALERAEQDVLRFLLVTYTVCGVLCAIYRLTSSMIRHEEYPKLPGVVWTIHKDIFQTSKPVLRMRD